MSVQLASQPLPVESASAQDAVRKYQAEVSKLQTAFAQVIYQMKEIPQLPSEKLQPGDGHSLKFVEFPDKGGILTHMDGYDLPYRGFPFSEFVDKIDTIKKISRGVLSGLFHAFKGNPLAFLPALWVAKRTVPISISAFHRIIDRFKIRRSCYSQPIRELHRAFSLERFEGEQLRETRFQLRDVVCMILEFDNAYRYRFQDIVVELNQRALVANPMKELSRLLTLIQSRETVQSVIDMWTLLKLFIQVYFRLDGKFRAMVVDVLTQLNLNEMKLSVEDEYFAKMRKEYAFGFVK